MAQHARSRERVHAGSDERALADRLHSAAIHLLRNVRRSDQLTGVSSAQLSALSVLMRGALTLGQIAAMEHVKPPTMSRLVAAMEHQKLIRRRGDAADRRLVVIALTTKGRRLLERERERGIADIESRLHAVPRERRVLLEEGVRALEQLLSA